MTATRPSGPEPSPVRSLHPTTSAAAPDHHGQPVEQLWREHHLDLRRFCVAVAGVADGDELAVEVFLRCAPKILAGTVDKPSAYLRAAALNSVRNLRRQRDREVLTAIDPFTEDRGTASGATGSAQRAPAPAPPSDWAHVRGAINDLSPRQRAVVFLAYWEGLSEREIADQLGISYGTVRRQMHRAQKRLRSELG